MKKIVLFNVVIFQVIVIMGYGDMLVIGDVGLLVFVGVFVIDLVVMCSVLDFMMVFKMVFMELQVEFYVVVDEMWIVSFVLVVQIVVLDLL